jgi:hypothetical protein
MKLILDTTEGSITTCRDARAGSLALWMAYIEGIVPMLILGVDQTRRAMILNAAREWALVTLDHRDPVLDLGPPVARYDAGSRRKQGHEAQAGDLVWADGRFGLRAAGGYRSGMSSWETPIVWLDGTASIHHHQHEHQAFTAWELGFMRDDRFVKVASAQVDPAAHADPV